LGRFFEVLKFGLETNFFRNYAFWWLTSQNHGFHVKTMIFKKFEQRTGGKHHPNQRKRRATSHSGYQAVSSPPVQPDAERCGEWQQDMLHSLWSSF